MFYEINSNFPFVQSIEDNWLTIKSEFNALGGSKFKDYEHSKDGGWKLMIFVMLDKRNDELADLCPETMRILQQVPNLTFAAISKLAKHSKIHPHREWIKNDEGFLYNNGNLHRCHLGLEIPVGIDEYDCAIRVSDEIRRWEPGKCLIFDDSVEHEAWNKTNDDRIVLVFDFIKDGDRFLESKEIRALQKHIID